MKIKIAYPIQHLQRKPKRLKGHQKIIFIFLMAESILSYLLDITLRRTTSPHVWKNVSISIICDNDLSVNKQGRKYTLRHVIEEH